MGHGEQRSQVQNVGEREMHLAFLSALLFFKWRRQFQSLSYLKCPAVLHDYFFIHTILEEVNLNLLLTLCEVLRCQHLSWNIRHGYWGKKLS